jgi:hypothetical protein
MAAEKQNAFSSTLSQMWAQIAPKLDQFLDNLYRYRGEYKPPSGISGQVWAMPPASLRFPWASAEEMQPAEYFLHYFQSQGCGPTLNECVTTSALMGMNMLKDRAALSHGQPAGILPDHLLEEYTRELDELGLRAWRYRFSTHSCLPGMMTPWQAVTALKDHAARLKAEIGAVCEVKLSAWHSLDDLIENLRRGNLMLLHGAWQMTLDPGKQAGYNPLLAALGGMPHTMLLIGYDAATEQWVLLNPADPWLTTRSSPASARFCKMTTHELLDFWGRQFLFYPPRFAITVISPNPN